MRAVRCGKSIGGLAAILSLFFSAQGCHCTYQWELTGPPPLAMSHTRLDLGEYHGISGLAMDTSGTLWAVPERQPALLPISIENPAPGLHDAPVPLEGIPAGHDIESLARVRDGTLALGLEGKEKARDEDQCLFYQFGEDGATKTDELSLPWTLWNIKAEANRGIEALCYAGGWLLAGGEMVGKTGGRRWAPVAATWIGREGAIITTSEWTPARLWLSSDSGKIAGLDCQLTGDGGAVVAYAIERHYTVSRILRFRFPLKGNTPAANLELTPVVIADLSGSMTDLPNLEGIVRLQDGHFLLISDNHSGKVTGDTEILNVTTQ